ncbi:MAG: ATP-binding cassette domain-containing protein [Firmicutes bacterium]|nr:ATP-binding cassette domain-containing protein [Bacillota bacterium]
MQHLTVGASPTRILDVSFTLQQGHITLVTGQTGSGKSTLLEAIAGLIPPLHGTIQIDNQSVYGRKGRLLPAAVAQLGICLQQPERQLFATTVREEILFALRRAQLTETERATRVRAALSTVRLAESMLDRSPLMLSGGQRRRVALASILVTNPRWLLFDEPTAGIDPRSAALFVKSVAELADVRAIGVLVATHDVDLWQTVASDIVTLTAGRMRSQSRMETGDRVTASRRGRDIPEAGTGVALDLALRQRGIRLATDFTSPAVAARALAGLLRDSARPAPSDCAPEPDTGPEPDPLDAGVQREAGTDQTAANTPLADSLEEPQSLPLRDPRALWLSLLLLSIGVLLQHSLPGLAVAGICVAWWTQALGTSARDVWRASRYFLLFLALAVAVAGLTVHGSTAPHQLPFTVSENLVVVRTSGLRLTRIFLLLVAALGLANQVPLLRMQKALHWLFRPLDRIKGGSGETAALGGALTLHFVPIIAAEASRIKRAVILRSRYRGEQRTLPRHKPHKPRRERLGFGDLRAFAVPLLLGILQEAEDLVTALEVRGYRLPNDALRMNHPAGNHSPADQTGTRSGRHDLHFTRADWQIVTIACASLSVLIVLKIVT